MHRLFAMAAAVSIASGAFATPARAEIVKTDAGLAGRNFCWLSGWDSEQYGRDHSYIYSYHMHDFNQGQIVIHGTWTISRDGTVTLDIDGGGTLVRRYEIIDDHVNELTGTLRGAADGHVC